MGAILLVVGVKAKEELVVGVGRPLMVSSTKGVKGGFV